MKTRCYLAVGICALLVSMIGGCGTNAIDTDRVEGVVTLNGVAVEGATVNFVPVVEGQGLPGFARTDANGAFKLQTTLGAVDAGTTPGEYKVTISKTAAVPTGRTIRTPEGETEDVTETKETLPARYQSAKDSPLSATVVKGQVNRFEFKLEP